MFGVSLAIIQVSDQPVAPSFGFPAEIGVPSASTALATTCQVVLATVVPSLKAAICLR